MNIVKWKHLQNGSHFGANFVNILKLNCIRKEKFEVTLKSQFSPICANYSNFHLCFAYLHFFNPTKATHFRNPSPITGTTKNYPRI